MIKNKDKPTGSGKRRPDREGRSLSRESRGRKKKEASERTRAVHAEPETWDVSSFKVPPIEGKVRFHDFDLAEPLMHAIFDAGFEYCTPIQEEILPVILRDRDATGRAQTGTGKTAAFLISVITRLVIHPLDKKRDPRCPRVLVLAPTRELVIQISNEAKDLGRYCSINVVPVFGGMDYVKQKRMLSEAPVDIVVATPGRLLDFQRHHDIYLNKTEVLIIDEADRMLDMGFIPDVRKIVHATPYKDKRQTLLFSATLTGEVTRLAAQWTKDPVTIDIEPEQVAVDTVDQIVYIVRVDEKFALLYNIIKRQNLDTVLVFCNRKDEVRRLSEHLTRYGINCSTLSGDVDQKKRIARLDQFKDGKIRILVATDVAGRGIHIEGMKHVINFTLPRDPEDYVHRIGRTGRAGTLGTSISFADEDDAFYITPIEEFIGRKLPCIAPDDDWLSLPELPLRPIKKEKRARSRRRR
ncbi:MAG: DEAD/DEAH box helicase [Deltaproteobacteria bacterium]|nr:DEAD/DEAH box helicase [Deltaproteobacteria bacterium]